jgi:hypothetical protein
MRKLDANQHNEIAIPRRCGPLEAGLVAFVSTRLQNAEGSNVTVEEVWHNVCPFSKSEAEKQRNDFIFNRSAPSFHGWKRNFCNEAYLQATRMKNDSSSAFLNLLDNYR